MDGAATMRDTRNYYDYGGHGREGRGFCRRGPGPEWVALVLLLLGSVFAARTFYELISTHLI